MRGMQHKLYLVAALGMLLYTIPRMEMGQGWTLSTIFWLSWIAFCVLIIAAQLYQIFGINEEKRRAYQQIKSMRRQQMEQMILGRKKVIGKR